MVEQDKIAIIKKFTETGIKILEADYGFAWWKFKSEEDYRLAYKSPKTPYTPYKPREGSGSGNYLARRTQKPFIDENVKKETYPEFDIYRYMKSYIIIPIHYGKLTYGNLILCYKKQHIFTDDELVLASAIGSTTAQAITIQRSVASEKEALQIAEKQKATEFLLEQEKLKTEFIANATHELRTPLAIMRGNVELALRKKGKDELKEARQALKKVNAEIERFAKTLSGLVLLISKK